MKTESESSPTREPVAGARELATASPLERWIGRLLWLGAALGLGAFTGAAIVYSFRLLAYPIEWDAAEGLARFQLDLLSRGLSAYGDPSRLPAFIANYPPLYPMAAWPVRVLLGDGYLALRLVSVGATAGTAMMLAIAARRAGVGWRWAALAPLLFVAAPYGGWWLPLARVDSLALFFLVLAFLIARRPSLAAVAFVLAAFTRQTAVLGALGLALFYWQQRDRRGLVIFTGVTAVLGGGALAAMQWMTDGWFWSHAVSYNANLVYWKDVPRYLGGYLGTMAVAVLASVAAPTLPRSARTHEPLAYLLVPGVLNALLVGKVGAAVNYFLPLQAALAFTATVGLARLVGVARRGALPTWLLAAGAFLQMMLWVPHEQRFDGPPAGNTAAIERMEVLVASASGPVFLERHIGFALEAGREVSYLPMPFKMLELSGDSIDLSAFHDRIAQEQFEMMVVRRGESGVGEFLDPESQRLIREHYRPEEIWTIFDADLTAKQYNVLVRRAR